MASWGNLGNGGVGTPEEQHMESPAGFRLTVTDIDDAGGRRSLS